MSIKVDSKAVPLSVSINVDSWEGVKVFYILVNGKQRKKGTLTFVLEVAENHARKNGFRHGSYVNPITMPGFDIRECYRKDGEEMLVGKYI